MSDELAAIPADQSGARVPSSVGWPWWMLPARLMGRADRRVLASAAADAMVLSRLPKIVTAAALPLLVVVLAGLVSALHATSVGSHSSAEVRWLNFSIDNVFTESPVFILAAIAIGVFSPALGVFLVVVFGVTDTLAALHGPYELHPFPVALVGRLIGLWLLWVVAVEVPIFGRQLGLSSLQLARHRLAVIGLTAAATGTFVWIWTQAAIVLVRPVFTWSSLPSGVRLEAIQPVQTAGLVFAIAGALIAGGRVAIARTPAEVMQVRLVRSDPNRDRRRIVRLRRLLGHVLGAALLTISLAGLISVPLEGIGLFVVIAGARPFARFVANRTMLGTTVAALPPVLRYVIAAALLFVLAQLIVPPIYALNRHPGTVPEFFSIIVALAIGILVLEVATTPGARPSAVTPASSATAIVALGGVLILLQLAAPVGVAADNCASLSDCFSIPFYAALFAMSLPFAIHLSNRFSLGDDRNNYQLLPVTWDGGAKRPDDWPTYAHPDPHWRPAYDPDAPPPPPDPNDKWAN